MSISRSDAKERNKYVLEARASGFLDAVFLIHYYNSDFKRWGPPPKPADITPQEVFGVFDEKQYDEAMKRARKLLSDASDVGAAFFEYQGVNRTYAEALALFRQNNPGFSERSYSLAASVGIRDMR